MNHPGFEAYHPINQDDESVLGSCFCCFLRFLLYDHPGYHPGYHPGIILVARLSYGAFGDHPTRIMLSSWAFAKIAAHPNRAVILVSSRAVILRRHPGAGSWYTGPSSWYHPAHGSQQQVVFGKVTSFIFGDSIILGD